MKGKTTWYRKLTAGMTAVLALAITLALTLGMLPASALKTQAAEISSITATTTDLVAPEIGAKLKRPTYTTADGMTVTEYGWTCDGEDRFEDDAITPGVWRIYTAALINKGSGDSFSSAPTLTVNSENWALSETFSDEYYYYAIFYKEYTLTTPIVISGDPEIPESYRNIPITNVDLSKFVSGGTAPYTYTAIYSHPWLTINYFTGVISGTPSTVGYNEDLYVLITDANGNKAVAEVYVNGTKLDGRPAVYDINAEGAATNTYVIKGNTLSPMTFTKIEAEDSVGNPIAVTADVSKSYWEKQDPETDEWKKQEGGTFTSGTYRYRVYTYSDSSTYSFAHPDFYLKTAEDDYEYWPLLNYNSDEAWGVFTSEEIIVPETLDKLTITDVPVPIEGMGATTAAISVKEAGAAVSDAKWYDNADNLIEDGTPFDKTKSYKISVTVSALEGITFAPKDSMTVTINGISTPATITSWAEDEITAEIEIPFGVFSSKVFVVTAGSLNVRDSASYNGDRIGGLKYGDVVEAQVESGGWVQFDYKGQDGWVNANYLALTASKQAAEALGGPKKIKVSVGALNVRSAPYIEDGNIIGGLTLNKEYLVTGKVTDVNGENWLVLEYPTESGFVVGYIMEKYTTDSSATTAIESAEVDVETPELHWTGGVPAHVSFAYKSAVAYDNNVTITDENYQDNGDGTYNVVIYPSDAMNFTTLQIADIQLSAELTAEDFIIHSLNVNDDGSISLKVGPEVPVLVPVKFETFGGSTVAEQEIAKGSTATRPEDPKKEGRSFWDWYTDPECTTKFDFTTTIKEETTLYAKWCINIKGVKLHADGTEDTGDGHYRLKADTLEALFENDPAEIDLSLTPLNSDSMLSSMITEAPAKGTTYYFAVVLDDVKGKEGTPNVFYGDIMKTGNEAAAEEATIEFVELGRSPGGKYATVIFSYTEAEIVYTFSKGGAGNWTKGSSETFDLTINRNINDDKTFSLCDSIEVDGKAIAASNYSASSGSLNASIKSSYLETLAAGTHTLKVTFEDGSAETKLTIMKLPAVLHRPAIRTILHCLQDLWPLLC